LRGLFDYNVSIGVFMENEIARKIAKVMDSGITSECQAVYFMVEVRKLMDKDREERDSKGAEPFPSIRLYSDWTVHVCLTLSRAKEFVKLADALYPKITAGTMTEEEQGLFGRLFSLDILREELTAFLVAKNIPSFSDKGWNSFLACFLNVIADCPLVCKADSAAVANVDEVVIVQDAARVPDGTPLPVIWALCFKGKFRQSIGGDPSTEDRIFEAIMAFVEAREK
jgi:hypothetical protein